MDVNGIVAGSADDHFLVDIGTKLESAEGEAGFRASQRRVGLMATGSENRRAQLLPNPQCGRWPLPRGREV